MYCGRHYTCAFSQQYSHGFLRYEQSRRVQAGEIFSQEKQEVNDIILKLSTFAQSIRRAKSLVTPVVELHSNYSSLEHTEEVCSLHTLFSLEIIHAIPVVGFSFSCPTDTQRAEFCANG